MMKHLVLTIWSETILLPLNISQITTYILDNFTMEYQKEKELLFQKVPSLRDNGIKEKN